MTEEPTLAGMPEQVDPIRHAGRTIIIKKTGERALLIGGTGRPGSVTASTAFSRHMYRQYSLDEIELAPERAYGRKGFDLKEDLTPIMTGLVDVPNFQPIPADSIGNFLNNLTLGGLWSPNDAGYTKLGWAKYFLRTTQGGAFDGTGYVIIYDSGGAIMGRFACCKHEVMTEAGA